MTTIRASRLGALVVLVAGALALWLAGPGEAVVGGGAVGDGTVEDRALGQPAVTTEQPGD